MAARKFGSGNHSSTKIKQKMNSLFLFLLVLCSLFAYCVWHFAHLIWTKPCDIATSFFVTQMRDVAKSIFVATKHFKNHSILRFLWQRTFISGIDGLHRTVGTDENEEI